MDPADSFFQALDSEQLLKEHGRSLVADARELLRKDPQAKVAGMITMPDSPDAPAIREFLAKMTGQAPPNGLLVGTVPRAAVEPLLRARTGTEHWLEQGWQPQRVLPVVVSTRDGHRFGFFPLTEGAAEAQFAQGRISYSMRRRRRPVRLSSDRAISARLDPTSSSVFPAADRRAGLQQPDLWLSPMFNGVFGLREA